METESNKIFCCDEKKRLMKNSAFLERLSLKPKVLVFTQHGKGRTYKKTIEVKNDDINFVQITLNSDFPNDLVYQTDENRQIEPQLSKTIDVFYEPAQNTSKLDQINRRHNIFISIQHPKVTIEVPIIIQFISTEMCVPKRIFFPKCVLNLTSYYCMSIYNPNKKPIIFTTKWNVKSSNIELLSDENSFAGKSCTRLVFSVAPTGDCSIDDKLLIIEGTQQYKVNFYNEVEPYEPYISRNYFRFVGVYYGFSKDEYFLVCNESMKPLKVKWCRNEVKEVSELSPKSNDIGEHHDKKHIDDHFIIIPKSATIPPSSSFKMRITFIPKPQSASYSGDTRMKFKSQAYLAFNTKPIRLPITLSGNAKGADIILNFCHIELGCITIGERRCIRVKALNTSSITGIIKFVGCDGSFGGVASCDPNYHILDPQEEKIFRIEYYGTCLGKCVEKILFRVENGRQLEVIISCVVDPIKVIPTPDTIDFGNTPICSLQKKELIVRNPMCAPIVVSLEVDNDGVQEPLIIRDFDEFVDNWETEDEELNTESKNHFMTCNQVEKINCGFDDYTSSSVSSIPGDNVEPDRSKEICRPKEGELVSQISAKSSGFIDICDNVSPIASTFVVETTRDRLIDDPHPDLIILNNITSNLFKLDYFEPLSDMLMKREKFPKLPNSPKEYLFSPELYFIKGFESCKIPIFLAPNRSGKFTTVLRMRVAVPQDIDANPLETEVNDINTITLPEEATITTVALNHNCIVPELEVMDEIQFDVGVDFPKRIDFLVKNLANITGIINFRIIDPDETAEVIFEPKRLVIRPLETLTCQMKVTCRIVGESAIKGSIGVFGGRKEYPFKIHCKSAPPKLKISVTPIKHTQKVLIKDVCMTYIINTGPALVQYEAEMKNGTYMKCDNPQGVVYPRECAEIRVSTFFYDPDLYKDALILKIKHLNIITIPIQVNAVGLPFKFKPDITDGFNLNAVATSNKPLITPIFIQCLAKKPYKISISRKKHLGNDDENSRFEFKENSLYVEPDGIAELELILVRKTSAKFKQEFTINAVEWISRKRVEGFPFIAEVELINVRLSWSKPQLEFDFRNSDFYEMSFGESVTLRNHSDITEEVRLEAVGSFEIFYPEKHTFFTKMELRLGPRQTKDLVICFDVKEINQWNRDVQYEGKILVISPEKNHASLQLLCKIRFPIVTLLKPSVRYYSLTPFVTYFPIENPGELLAFYQWSHQAIPSRQPVVRPIKNEHFQTVLDYTNLLGPINMFTQRVDIKNEWLTSFEKMLDYDLEEDVNHDEEEEQTLTSESIQTIFKPVENRLKEKKSRKIAPQDSPHTPKSLKKDESKKTKGKNKEARKKVKPSEELDNESRQTKSPKSPKINPKSKKSPLKPESMEDIIPQIEEPKPPDFICKEHKLNVTFSEIANKIRQVLQIKSELGPYDKVKLCGLKPHSKASMKSNTTDTESYFALDHYRGSISPGAQKKMCLYFSGDSEDVEIKSILIMDVVGGKSETLNVTVSNTRIEIEISKNNFNVGSQPWYKANYFKVNIKNINPNPVQITPKVNEYNGSNKRFLSGYIDFRPKQSFLLQPGFVVQFDIVAFMGLNQRFFDALGIEVNGGIPASIFFRGCASVPMISILNFEKLPLDEITTEQEYEILNKIFINQLEDINVQESPVSEYEILECRNALGIFNPEEMDSQLEDRSTEMINGSSSSSMEVKSECQQFIRTPAVNLSYCLGTTNKANGAENENSQTKPSTMTATELVDPESSNKATLNNLHFTESRTIELLSAPKRPEFRATVLQVADPDLIDYCVLDYPQKYPNSVQLQYLTEVQNFQNDIFQKKFAWKNYGKIIQKEVTPKMDIEKQTLKETKFQQPIRPTHFKIQPLPYYSSSYKFNFGTISLGQQANWTFDIFYHGPGKANFSIRSLIVIPGMKITFLEPSFDCDGVHGDYKFTIYNNDLNPKENYKYRNINSRSSEDIQSVRNDCGDCQGKTLCHAHSYDFDPYLIHTRETNALNRRAINEFYSWWNNPNREVKDPNIHCELFQERLGKTAYKIFKFNIDFKPTSNFYNDPTFFEDFIYIDIHLGPTVPILLQGTISSAKTSGSESMNEE